MNLKAPINENYAATVVTIKNLVTLDNCDNVVHTNIFGNMLVVGKDTKVGDKGLFFPVETRLHPEFLYNNNLYRDNTLNANINDKGYFEENGRIKCAKFRGHKSEGIFLPMKSLIYAAEPVDVAAIPEGSCFDEINGMFICSKYTPRSSHTTEGSPNSKKYAAKIAKKVCRIAANQFRFHSDTPMLGKNISKIKPNTLLHITNKLHGTSFITGSVLCKRKLGWFEKAVKWLGGQVNEYYYDMIYSSRKVIKNDDLNKDYRHYYGEDVWKEIADRLTPYLTNGLTLYGEAVGFTKEGGYIQRGYDYGCNAGDWEGGDHMGIYIYKITYTNTIGQVYTFSGRQVQEWCKHYGLKAVPEYFYGFAKDLLSRTDDMSLEEWQGEFLSYLLSAFNMEKSCEICKNSVPAEGLAVSIEDTLDYDVYKLKSFAFRERESRELDKGVVDMETTESEQ